MLGSQVRTRRPVLPNINFKVFWVSLSFRVPVAFVVTKVPAEGVLAISPLMNLFFFQLLLFKLGLLFLMVVLVFWGLLLDGLVRHRFRCSSANCWVLV